MKNTTRNSEQL